MERYWCKATHWKTKLGCDRGCVFFLYQCSLPAFLACSASWRCRVAAAAKAAALSFWNSAATAWWTRGCIRDKGGKIIKHPQKKNSLCSHQQQILCWYPDRIRECVVILILNKLLRIGSPYLDLWDRWQREDKNYKERLETQTHTSHKPDPPWSACRGWCNIWALVELSSLCSWTSCSPAVCGQTQRCWRRGSQSQGPHLWHWQWIKRAQCLLTMKINYKNLVPHTIRVNWIIHFFCVVDLSSHISTWLIKKSTLISYWNDCGTNKNIKWVYDINGNRLNKNGYKEALSVRVFHTIGRICCMEDTMGLGKFFTRAVTAYEKITIHNYNYIMRGKKYFSAWRNNWSPLTLPFSGHYPKWVRLGSVEPV